MPSKAEQTQRAVFLIEVDLWRSGTSEKRGTRGISGWRLDIAQHAIIVVLPQHGQQEKKLHYGVPSPAWRRISGTESSRKKQAAPL